jgi:choline dehydrogenase-like flavoprotein
MTGNERGRRNWPQTIMTYKPPSNGVKLALLEAQLLEGDIDRSAFLERAATLGLPRPEARTLAEKFLAIASNQAIRRKNIKASYDYIVIGSGAAGSVVARRLVENFETQVLLLEAGEADLKPNLLITENWYLNQGGPMDWAFTAEPSPALNNRSIHQAMAGAIQTPKILMLSGIGNRVELARLGIATVSNVPGVGRNFQDHPIIGAGLWEPCEFIPARANAAEANVFVKSRPDLDTPDLHIWHVEAPYVSEATMKYAVESAWSINPGLVRPDSRGYLRLKSANPRDAPEIHANMLDDPRDLVAVRKGMEISRELGNSNAMTPFVKREILPGDLRGEALDNLIRDGAMSMHHATCTAKMGRDELSVVDAELRVYGVNSLRIADGSIMPTITTGNTQAPCVIIGERMAEILRA